MAHIDFLEAMVVVQIEGLTTDVRKICGIVGWRRGRTFLDLAHVHAIWMSYNFYGVHMRFVRMCEGRKCAAQKVDNPGSKKHPQSVEDEHLLVYLHPD
jgi:hypothetical protein